MATVSASESSPQPAAWYCGMGKRGLRSVGFGVLFGIVLSVVRQQNMGITLIYSVLISCSCWVCIDFGRVGVARWVKRDGAAAEAQAGRGWPGWPWALVVVILGSVVGFTVGNAGGDLITGSSSTNLYNAGSLRDGLSLLLLALVPAIALTYFYYSREVLADREASIQAARGQAAESRLKLLESQLEPHMLFNTLANLRVLITLDPPRAEAMLDQLIAYLRATLNASRAAHHSLAQEFARLADYLALAQVRMADRLDVLLDLPSELQLVEIPPLLLQPLVENCIKHGLEPSVRGGSIRIGAEREGDTLVLRVRDTGVGLRDGGVPDQCFGLAQVRERLATLYGSLASLRLESAADPEGGCVATIRLPLTGPAPR